jgi:hypothetical protein
MNRKALIALAAFAALAGTTAARADDITIDNTPFQSVRTRADVQSELLSYKKNGVNTYSISYNQLSKFKSDRTRDEVRAEYIADRDEVAALTSEDSGSAYLAHYAPANRSTTLAATSQANSQLSQR